MKLGHLERVPRCPYFGDNNDHQCLLATYPSPGMILQVGDCHGDIGYSDHDFPPKYVIPKSLEVGH